MANRSDVVEQVQAQTGILTSEAELMVDSVCEAIARLLVDGEQVALEGFGRFHITEVGKASERVGVVPPHRRVTFRPSSRLRDALHGRAPLDAEEPAA